MLGLITNAAVTKATVVHTTFPLYKERVTATVTITHYITASSHIYI